LHPEHRGGNAVLALQGPLWQRDELAGHTLMQSHSLGALPNAGMCSLVAMSASLNKLVYLKTVHQAFLLFFKS